MEGSMFWMADRLATGLLEVSEDPKCLEDGKFWAVLITYEGEFRAARFGEISESKFPATSKKSEITGNWRSTHSQSQYIDYVERVRNQIEQGDVYQVNACRILSNESDVSLMPTFSRILDSNPSPLASYFTIPGIEIASASPELFLERFGSKVKTSPIKGTKKLDSERFGNKDRAENIMIVDLMRNDLSKVCLAGSIQVPELLRDEEHPGLSHLVSDVVGELAPGNNWVDIFAELLPAGSISGAPKSSATRIITENELSGRGPYCGVIGWVQGDDALLSVGIRIFWRENKQIKFGTGAGITWGSVGLEEWDETNLKAARLITLAGGNL